MSGTFPTKVMSPKISLPIFSVICYVYCLLFYTAIKGVEESPFIIVTRTLSYPESSAAVHTDHIYKAVTPFIFEKADPTILPNFFRTIEQAIKQAYLNLQVDLLPAKPNTLQVLQV